MTSTISGYDISYRVVDEVDNQGESCVHCQDVDAVVSRTVYMVVDGERTLFDCCEACTSRVVLNADADWGIVIEIGAGAIDDRMRNQDDTRPHPDAL